MNDPQQSEVQHNIVENGNDQQENDRSSILLRKIARTLLLLLGLLLLFRIFVFSPFGIPTSSMSPTIIPGDVILVNKLPYIVRTPTHIPFTGIPLPHAEFSGPGELERGDVVVFQTPEPGRSEGADKLVKRCVALTGDTISLSSGRLYVNGLPLTNRDGTRPDSTPLPKLYQLFRDLDQVIVPYEGYDLELPDSATAQAWRDALRDDGIEVSYKNGIVFLSGRPATRYRFRHDYFLALGDNSGDSRDSRYFGFVPYDHLIGQALFVYWSRSVDGEIRWNRIGHGID